MASDMAALNELVAEVEAGWSVDIVNHDHTASSGTAVITALSQNVHGSGRSGFHDVRGERGGYYMWPTPEQDFEVEGRTLRLYDPSHAYVGGRRAITLTMTFTPPTP